MGRNGIVVVKYHGEVKGVAVRDKTGGETFHEGATPESVQTKPQLKHPERPHVVNRQRTRATARAMKRGLVPGGNSGA